MKGFTMFNKLSTKLDRPKQFVARHKTALTITSTALVTASVVHRMESSLLNEALDFIADADLLDQFENYAPSINV